MAQFREAEAEEFFSVDLVSSARAHIDFLRRVHAAGLSQRRASAESVRRYRDLWLPLLASRGAAALAAAEDAVPPLDVAWLWHCHRLAPRAYRKACVELHGAADALDAPRCAFASQDADDAAAGADGAAATRARWAARYPSEPFDRADADAGSAPPCAPRDALIAGFDVAESAQRQETFLWQVSGARYAERAFLDEGVARYAKFLGLMAAHPAQFVVPTYQIDLMWHTHILASARAYESDAAALAGGAAPDHDDSVNDRSAPETKLNVSTDATKRLWAQEYGEEFAVRGGMYRGEPPDAYWSAAWPARDAAAKLGADARLDAEIARLVTAAAREALGLDGEFVGGAPAAVDVELVPAGGLGHHISQLFSGGGAATPWECETDSGWSEYGADIAGLLEGAVGPRAAVSWDAHGFSYSVDWGTVQQVNGKTGRRRAIRRSVAGAPTELGAAAPQAVPVTVAAAQSFYVQVPPNGAPGATMRVTAPNGVVIDIVIPPGAGPGASFEVSTPAAPGGAHTPAAPSGRRAHFVLPQCAMDPSPTFRWEYEDQYVITGGTEPSKTLREADKWKALDATLGFKLEAARIRGSPQVPDSSGSVAMVYDVAAMTQTHTANAKDKKGRVKGTLTFTRRIRRVDVDPARERACARCGMSTGSMTNRGEARLTPCGHAGVCETCAAELQSHPQGVCPFCRVKVTNRTAFVTDDYSPENRDACFAARVLRVLPQELWASTATLLTLDTSKPGDVNVRLPGKAGWVAGAMNSARAAVLDAPATAEDDANAPRPDDERATGRLTLLRVIADEVARGDEARAPTAPSAALVEYDPLLVFVLGGSDGQWRDDKGFALCRFLGCPLVDRAGLIDVKLSVKSLYPIPAKREGFNTPLREVMLARAREIVAESAKLGEIDVLWSGGIDTTAVVCALLLETAGDAAARARLRVRYCARSVGEYPAFFAQVIQPLLKHELIDGHVRDAFDATGVRRVVTGDPADMLFGTFVMAGAFKRETLVDYRGRNVPNPLFMGLEKPWQDVVPKMLHARGLLLNRSEEEDGSELRRVDKRSVVASATKEWVAYLDAHARRAPIRIVSTFDWLWWITYSCKYQHDLLRICANREGDAPGSLAGVRASALNFYEGDDFEQWSFAFHHEKMPDKRVWASYKWPLKAFVREACRTLTTPRVAGEVEVTIGAGAAASDASAVARANFRPVSCGEAMGRLGKGWTRAWGPRDPPAPLTFASPHDEYYATKIKVPSVNNGFGNQLAIDDNFTPISFGAHSVSLLRLEQKYGPRGLDHFLSPAGKAHKDVVEALARGDEDGAVRLMTAAVAGGLVIGTALAMGACVMGPSRLQTAGIMAQDSISRGVPSSGGGGGGSEYAGGTGG